MKKQIALLALCGATAVGFVSCQDDFDPYYRFSAHDSEFIKAFGQPDPDQDWNMAVSKDLDINLGARKAKSVKVYGNIAGADYYLLASIRNTSGAIRVPVDVSELTSDIVVTVDGDVYSGKPDQIIDCTGQTTSRAILVDPANAGDPYGVQKPTTTVTEDGDGNKSFNIDPFTATHNYGTDYKVEVSFPDQWEFFNAQQIAALTATENWTKYLSLNQQITGTGISEHFRKNPVALNPDNIEDGQGILPESGILNQPYHERTSNNFGYSFTIEVPVNPEYEPNSTYVGKLQPGEFMIFPYYYGTNKKHDMYMYFVDKYNQPTEWQDNPYYTEATKAVQPKRIPKLYPIFQDSNGDDLQIVPRPMVDIASIEGMAVYEYVRRDNDEYNSYANIGRRIGEFRVGVTDPTTGEKWDGNTITLAATSTDYTGNTDYNNVWLIPIIKRKDGTFMDIYRFLESTTLPRMLQGYEDYTNKHDSDDLYEDRGGNAGYFEPKTQELFITKRGLTHIKESQNGTSVRLQVRLQTYDESAGEYGKVYVPKKAGYEGMGIGRRFNIKIDNEKGLRVPKERDEAVEFDNYIGFIRSNTSFFDIENDFFKIINDYKGTSYSLAQMNEHTSMSETDVAYRNKFIQDVVDAYEAVSATPYKSPFDGLLNDVPVARYTNEGFAVVESMPDRDVVHYHDGLATLHKARHTIVPEFETKQVQTGTDDNGDPVYETKLVDGIINANYFQLKVKVLLNTTTTTAWRDGNGDGTFDTDVTTDAMKAAHKENGHSDPKSPARFNVYNEQYVFNELLNKNNYTDADFKPVHLDYDPYRPYREETSSFYTEVPMLCRSHGYKVKVYKKDDKGTMKPYTGRIGLALMNEYTASADGTAGNMPGPNNTQGWAKFYTFSQRHLNRYTQDGSTYEYDYAVAINHPVSGRQFFAFEDWEITHPGVGDVDINNKVSDRKYNGYDWTGGGTGASSDYSSDRDYNDLIFRLEGAKLAEDPENRPINLNSDTFPWIWALEDLGSTGDFDFNDIIVRISTYTFGEGEGDALQLKKDVIFSPMAAGGTLPIYLHIDLLNKTYGDNGHIILAPTARWALDNDKASKTYGKYVLTPLNLNGDGNKDGIVDFTNGEAFSTEPAQAVEYHKWFGGKDKSIPSDRSYKIMLNTGDGDDVNARDVGVCRFIVGAEDFMVNHGSRNASVAIDAITEIFYVSVGSANVTELSANEEAIDPGRLNMEEGAYLVWNKNKGRAAQSFIISEQMFEWSAEYIHIADSYPQFPEWVKNGNNNTWFFKANASDDASHHYHGFAWPGFPTYDNDGNLNPQKQ